MLMSLVMGECSLLSRYCELFFCEEFVCFLYGVCVNGICPTLCTHDVICSCVFLVVIAHIVVPLCVLIGLQVMS